MMKRNKIYNTLMINVELCVCVSIILVTDNLVLPAGTTVIIPQFLIHRRPEFYQNPSKFDPDNFLPERCQNRHYYSFIPFSAGPRSCVG